MILAPDLPPGGPLLFYAVSCETRDDTAARAALLRDLVLRDTGPYAPGMTLADDAVILAQIEGHLLFIERGRGKEWPTWHLPVSIHDDDSQTRHVLFINPDAYSHLSVGTVFYASADAPDRWTTPHDDDAAEVELSGYGAPEWMARMQALEAGGLEARDILITLWTEAVGWNPHEPLSGDLRVLEHDRELAAQLDAAYEAERARITPRNLFARFLNRIFLPKSLRDRHPNKHWWRR
ncbi:MAG: hypothetical protein Q4G25_05875 [Paracoccus sp. (in: a-proteobacteria)]|nr:hypothetical protein [Paracoccus sp. (in: a-proteobacteria)]